MSAEPHVGLKSVVVPDQHTDFSSSDHGQASHMWYIASSLANLQYRKIAYPQSRSHHQHRVYVRYLRPSLKTLRHEKMSNPPGAGLPSWLWSPSLQSWYYHDEQRGEYVLADGRRIALGPSAQVLPPTVERPAQAPSTNSRYGRATSAGRSATEYRPSDSASARTAVYRSSQSVVPEARNTTAAGQSETQVSNAMSANGIMRGVIAPESRIIRSYDHQSDVSAFQLASPQEVTEPALYQDGIRAHARILNRMAEGDHERLDPAFRIRNRPDPFFVTGRVFLVLWAEPAGANSAVTSMQFSISRGAHQEYVFSKVRRFVVVRPGTRCCSALPIVTYSRRPKGDFVAEEHSVVYTGREIPRGKVQTPGLQPESIKVLLDDPTDKLDPESLINYGKVYTIEHNLKVKPFGMVQRDSIQHFTEQFMRVWISRVGLRRETKPSSRASLPSRSSTAQGLPLGIDSVPQPLSSPLQQSHQQHLLQGLGAWAAKSIPEVGRSGKIKLGLDLSSPDDQAAQSISDAGGSENGKLPLDVSSQGDLGRKQPQSRLSDHERLWQMYLRIKEAMEDKGHEPAKASEVARKKVEEFLSERMNRTGEFTEDSAFNLDVGIPEALAKELQSNLLRLRERGVGYEESVRLLLERLRVEDTEPGGNGTG